MIFRHVMARRIAAVLALLAAAAAGGCDRPPQAAYATLEARTASTAMIPIGSNAAGEACTQPAAPAASVDIYCGTWQQPSATVRRDAPVAAGQLGALAESSPWRSALDARFTCGPPSPTTILGNQPALAMQCARKVGGWPQVALVALVGNATYEADGVQPALPAIERSIGVLSGLMRPEAAAGGAAASGAAATSLLATRLAAQAFSSGDIGQYEQLMQAGTRANLEESFADAEQAFRAALALQQKALGHDDPNTVTPLTYLALQVSDQGRYAEADALFARADLLAGRAADPSALPRLLHFRGLHALNQGNLTLSLEDLRRADAGYTALLPPQVLTARPKVQVAQTGRLSDMRLGQDVIVDPSTRPALLGLVEVDRYRGMVLRALDRRADSDAAIQAAEALALGNDVDRPIITARLFRTQATAAGARGDYASALTDLARPTAAFEKAVPGTRPVAETALLSAAVLHRDHHDDDALALCRRAIDLLRQLRAGTTSDLMEPCLGVYAAEADAQPAKRQVLLAEMFAASQLAQGGVTSQQIALASARLSANAKDPKVGEAIRRRQDAGTALADLYSQRDALRQQAVSGPPQAAGQAPVDPAELDRRIAAAQSAVAEADAALQAAAPNYGQLVQQVAPAADVLAALPPGGSFASLTLTDDGGWVFLLRDGRVSVARNPDGAAKMADLVRRVRAGIEPTGPSLPSFDVAAAQRIYTDLFGSLDAELRDAKSLVVAPAGPLLSLPFEVLLTGDADAAHLADAPFLVRRLVISHVPAAANFVSLRKIAGGSRAGRPWFGFGDFRPSTLAQAQKTYPGASCQDSAKLFAGLPPLPFAKRELDAARALLGGAPADQMLGAGFTAAAVQKAALKDYRILHFATHALLPTDLTCQSEPAIVTSDPAGATDAAGALLTASQVANLDLDADAVILSACNSGGPGGATAGESLSGLARAFFYAGARALVVTHWSVNDQAAAFLVADTMRRLGGADRPGIAGALRAAQIGILDGAGHDLPADYAHPFYWAPFAVIGEDGAYPAATAAAPDRKTVPKTYL